MSTNRIYVTLVSVGLLTAIGGILMRVSGKASLYEPGTILGWSGIVLALAARVVFGRRRRVPSSRKEQIQKN